MFNDANDAFLKDEPAFVYYNKNNFAGIQGVVASKISEKFGIPTIMLADIDNSLVSGSGRAGQFLHLQNALQTFDEEYPDILISYGGHKAAAGVKLHKNNIKTFQNGFYNIVKQQLQGQDITPYIKTDGSLKEQISFGTYKQIEQLSPFGIGFPTPVFFDKMVVTNLRVMGKIPVHLSMMLDGHKAVFFNALKNPEDPLPLFEGERIAVTYTLNLNVWQGIESLQLIIKSIIKSHESV